ncbi:MAG: hypothetical protein P8N51_11145 [Pseudomonadales bacterium]|nr:hypothetical protein [Pseudomonadales bacterium]MDG1441129.1 hypothetical protein [Pseudomonadales bacterium]
MKKLLLILACLLPISVVADDHVPVEPIISAIYECTLNEGVSVDDVVAFGSGAVKKFASKNELAMNSYLWEAVAVNEPYNEADVRWVNYYPTWTDYYATGAVFANKGSNLVSKFNELLSCEKPVIMAAQNLMSDLVVAQQKPFVGSVCNLNEGKSMQDAMMASSQLIGLMNESTDANVGGSILTPAFGITGFDYVATFYGEIKDMATLMDSVRDRSLATALAKADFQPAATCVNDLHMSHLMVHQGQ